MGSGNGLSWYEEREKRGCVSEEHKGRGEWVHWGERGCGRRHGGGGEGSVAPVPNSEGKIMEKNHPNKDYTEQVNRDMMVVAELKSEEEKSAKLERETRKEKDEDDDSGDDEDGILCPGYLFHRMCGTMPVFLSGLKM
ncbi:hypothetical protein DEO72_LG7g1026 [Vigna unguiculata]|uniref:Uncharacterized protein n=1 Tax=Vigna unguiculata TaxID=3917 RepID=A0A4D6MGU3_VIGUN|nr:hypothetical protein DEO72_LG7g1026 [Vigna unguiculata]